MVEVKERRINVKTNVKRWDDCDESSPMVNGDLTIRSSVKSQGLKELDTRRKYT